MQRNARKNKRGGVKVKVETEADKFTWVDLSVSVLSLQFYTQPT